MSEEYRQKNNITPGSKGQYAFVHKKYNKKAPKGSDTESEEQLKLVRRKVRREWSCLW